MSWFLVFHLATIIPVLVLGPFIFLRQKGDRKHKMVGRLWASLMIISCMLSFGIRQNGKFSWLHGLAAFTIYQVIRGVLAIRRGDINIHQKAMIGSYIGAVIAFLFATLSPDRLIRLWISKIF